jgi:hypothetical protein
MEQTKIHDKHEYKWPSKSSSVLERIIAMYKPSKCKVKFKPQDCQKKKGTKMTLMNEEKLNRHVPCSMPMKL